MQSPEKSEPRILVVEDVPVLAETASAHLRAAGCVPMVATNGAAGLAAAATFRPDLVLLDMMMPVVDGIEFLRRAKSVEALRGVPILMLSAVNERDKVVQCLLLGAVDYVLKPFDAAVLLRKVRKHVKPRAAQAGGSAAPAPASAEVAVAGGLPVALVAANSADVIDALRAALAPTFTVHVARDGAAALDAAAQCAPRFVVTEAKLPVFDGVEVIARIKAAPETAAVPCALVAAKTEFDLVRRAREIAGVELLARPIDPEAVAKVVAVALGEDPAAAAAAAAPSDPEFDPAPLQALKDLPLSPGEESPIGPILDAYFNDAPTRIAVLKSALEESDPATLAAAAHALKGGSGSVGASGVAKLCAEIEAAAKGGSAGPGAAAIPRIEESLAKFKDAVERWRGSAPSAS